MFSGKNLRNVLAAAVLCTIAAVSPFAHAELPAVKFMSGSLVSPANGLNYYETLPTPTTHTISVPNLTRATEIRELANGLGKGVVDSNAYAQRVYEYVYNNVRVSFLFGSHKGPLGALLDQAGTPFDQASLMVELLREAEITANYEVGTISLTTAQATAWFGMNNARAICRLLADGGIPATVNGSSSATCSMSGTVSSVTMLHVWVSAPTLSKRFDPSFKTHVAKAPINLATAVQCGTQSGCTGSLTTIRSTATSALASGADQTPVTGSSETIRYATKASLESQLGTWSTNLKAKLDASYFDKETIDIVGGLVIDAAAVASNGTLPYGSPVAQRTWTEIPDAYRATLTIRYDHINKKVFADEVSGKRLRMLFTAYLTDSESVYIRVSGLYLEFQNLGMSIFENAVPAANAAMFLDVNHPYAAASGTYMDETIQAGASLVPLMSWSRPPDYNGYPMFHTAWDATIVHGWGEAGMGTVTQFSAQQRKEQLGIDTFEVVDDTQLTNACNHSPVYRYPNFPVGLGQCSHPDRPVRAAHWLAQTSRMAEIVGSVNSTVITHHHSVGIISWNDALNAETSVSTISKSNSVTDRRAANYSYAAVAGRLEGSVREQLNSSWEGGASASVMARANEKGIRYARYTTAANYQASLPTPSAGVIQYLNDGYSVVAPTEQTSVVYTVPVRKYNPGSTVYPSNTWNVVIPATFVAVKQDANSVPDRIAHLVAGGFYGGLFKGANSNIAGDDPYKSTLQTTKLQDVSQKSRKYFGVDVASGTLRLTPPPDLVTGAGAFPLSLSFSRFYDSRAEVLPSSATAKDINDVSACDGDLLPIGSECYLQLSYGTDSSVIGRGWDHNWNISASITSDAMQGMGEDSPVDAIAAITSVLTLRALTNDIPSFLDVVASSYVANWFGSNLVDNVVVVKRPPASASFVRLPDGSFNSPPASAETLVQTGAVSGLFGKQPDRTFPEVPVLNDYTSLQLTLTDKYGSLLQFQIAQNDIHSGDTLGFRQFRPTRWSFPTGVVISFAFNTATQPHCLTGVSNNLGRQITFVPETWTYATQQHGTITRPPDEQCYVKEVKDESNRTVAFSRPGAQSLYGQTGTGAFFGGLYSMPELRVTTPDNATTRYVYTETLQQPAPRQGSVITAIYTPTDHTNAFMTAAYDSLLRVRSTTDAVSQTTNYQVGGLGTEKLKRGAVRDPLSAVTTSYFGKFGETLQQIDALNRTVSQTYDGRQRLIRTTQPEGNYVRHQYDKRHNETYEYQHPKPNSALAVLTRRTIYASTCTNSVTCNLPTSERDFLDRTIATYSYNATTGLPTRVTRAAVTQGTPLTHLCYTGYSIDGSTVYLLTGRIERATSTANRVTRFEYNSGNRYVLQRVTADPSTSLAVPSSATSMSCGPASPANALNLANTLEFDSVGNIHSINGPRIDVVDVTEYGFDDMRRLKRITAPLGAVTRYDYDLDGLLRFTHRSKELAPSDSNAAHWQTEAREYWPTGQLRSVTDAESNITRYTYDAAGRTDVVTDPSGRKTKSEYYSTGELLRNWLAWESPNRPAIRNAEYTYTDNGRQRTVRDANGNTTRYGYDNLDRPRFTYFPDGANGSLCTEPTSEDAAPICTGAQTYEQTSHTLDGLAASALCSGNADVCVKRQRNAETIRLTYDALSRAETKAVSGTPALGTVTTVYNLLGEPTSISSPVSGSIPAHAVSYDYDAVGRKRYEQNLLNGINRSVAYEYDEAGNRRKTTWPDSYHVQYTYDALNRMQYVRENSTNEIAYYTYDPQSRRTNLCLAGSSGTCTTTATNKVGYTYEPDGQLDLLTHRLNATTVSLDYGYNAAGQITNIVANDAFYLPMRATGTTTYSPNRLNQYGSVNGQASSFDPNGNLLTWYPALGRHTYTYDTENRLRTAAVNGSATATIMYDYDTLGRRISKTVSGESTYYLLDGDEEIAEYNGAGTLQRRYVTGTAIDDRIARAEGSAVTNPTKYYYHVNHQGSVIGMTDAAGTITQQMAYDEYGNLTKQSPASPSGEPFRYTGRRFDLETGLYYYRARYYSPELGRFLQTDPIGYKDDFNLYAYVGNNPLNKTDPSGLCPDACVIEGGVAAGTALVYAVVSVGVVLGCIDFCGRVKDGIKDLASSAWSALSGKSSSDSSSSPSSSSETSAPTPSDGERESTLKPGPYAGDSIPARGPGRDFTPEEREKINEIGKETGCHTCGTKDPGTKSGNFVPDHQPPNAANPNGESQRLYPHCLHCSHVQGGEARQVKPPPPPDPLKDK